MTTTSRQSRQIRLTVSAVLLPCLVCASSATLAQSAISNLLYGPGGAALNESESGSTSTEATGKEGSPPEWSWNRDQRGRDQGVSGVSPGRVSGLPHYSIEQSCRALFSFEGMQGVQERIAGCLDDERNALSRLGSLKVSEQAFVSCSQEADFLQSYTHLEQCVRRHMGLPEVEIPVSEDE